MHAVPGTGEAPPASTFPRPFSIRQAQPGPIENNHRRDAVPPGPPSGRLRHSAPRAGLIASRHEGRHGPGSVARITPGKTMTFSFSSLLRMIVLLALGLDRAGHRRRPARPGPARLAVPEAVRISNVNELLPRRDRPRTALDRRGDGPGRRPPAGRSATSWRRRVARPGSTSTGRRRSSAAGRAGPRTGPMAMSSDFGLARYSFPGGEVLDHVSTPTIVPIGPPCWFPGTRAQVLVRRRRRPALPLRLRGRPVGPRPDPARRTTREPAPITWRCRAPGRRRGLHRRRDWPEDPRCAGPSWSPCGQQVTAARRPKYSRTQLWWLKLNNAGTEIVEAGPPDRARTAGQPAADVDERSPSVATGPDGR